MTEHELFHKWLGGQSGIFIDELVELGLSPNQARNYIHRVLTTVERRRGHYAQEGPVQINPKSHTYLDPNKKTGA